MERRTRLCQFSLGAADSLLAHAFERPVSGPPGTRDPVHQLVPLLLASRGGFLLLLSPFARETVRPLGGIQADQVAVLRDHQGPARAVPVALRLRGWRGSWPLVHLERVLRDPDRPPDPLHLKPPHGDLPADRALVDAVPRRHLAHRVVPQCRSPGPQAFVSLQIPLHSPGPDVFECLLEGHPREGRHEAQHLLAQKEDAAAPAPPGQETTSCAGPDYLLRRPEELGCGGHV